MTSHRDVTAVIRNLGESRPKFCSYWFYWLVNSSNSARYTPVIVDGAKSIDDTIRRYLENSDLPRCNGDTTWRSYPSTHFTLCLATPLLALKNSMRKGWLFGGVLQWYILFRTSPSEEMSPDTTGESHISSYGELWFLTQRGCKVQAFFSMKTHLQNLWLTQLWCLGWLVQYLNRFPFLGRFLCTSFRTTPVASYLRLAMIPPNRQTYLLLFLYDIDTINGQYKICR